MFKPNNSLLANASVAPNSSAVLRIRDVEPLSTDATLLRFQSEQNHFWRRFSETLNKSTLLAQAPFSQPDSDEEEVVIEGKRQKPTTSPVYTIDSNEIFKQGADSAAEILRGLPGFAINDVGYGADIHTGTYYRGASINQSVFLLNGRPIGTNISTYHGGTDLNSISTSAIEQVELSSGTSATLYGSEAVGGVVNIITKKGGGTPTLNGLAQFGSFDTSTYRGNFTGSAGALSYALSYERFQAENDYRVPVGAANRGADGRLFNGDVKRDSYYGNLSLDLNPRNTLSLDVSTLTSRRGLLYFGFPLQRDRLNHDQVNAGLSWRAMLGNRDDSTLTTTLSFNQDYFTTEGPAQGTFSRTGRLDSRALNARIEHNWQTSRANNLRWGVDMQAASLAGETLSSVPRFIQFNGEVDRDRFQTALFALNTLQLSNTLQAEVGLRQNFTSDFGSYLNPSVGARWAVSPTLAVRGSWVSVHRNPGLDQLYIYDTVHNWLPNPDLTSETGSSWSAGLDIQFAPRLLGQFTYFGSRLNDRLGIIAGRWENVGLVNTNGLEAAVRWQIAPQWSTFVNYTYTDAKIGSGTEKGLQLSFVPYSVARLGIGYRSNGWEVNLYTSYFSGARRAFFLNPGDSNREFSSGWLNLDLGLRIPVSKQLGVTVFLENLADRSYEKSNRIYQPGLTYRIGLQSTF
ncbi:TonB-dependent receptor [Myxacorys almedinensis A]|uniref:TonB-dependent receptor n=1 Tax=Myxacorys almedinensis A TaxID=2690445 RepID=A0A8J8CHQ4_9CYAN|nr:TonB-dependent receptor [Myxacorys almedinensis A]